MEMSIKFLFLARFCTPFSPGEAIRGEAGVRIIFSWSPACLISKLPTLTQKNLFIGSYEHVFSYFGVTLSIRGDFVYFQTLLKTLDQCENLSFFVFMV